MDKNNTNIGKIGEDMACSFLVKNMHKILFKNYREGFDEIDIIARSFDGILIFVEVKTLRMKNVAELMPEDNLTLSKFKKISRACRLFVGSHKELIDKNKGWRMDLITIALYEDGKSAVKHYENITASFS